MGEFLVYEAKVAVVLAVLYLFYKLLLSRDTFHRFNRAVLVGTVILAFILPFCVITVHRTVELPAIAASTSVSAGTSIAAGSNIASDSSIAAGSDSYASGAIPAASSEGSLWWMTALAVIYFTGVAFMLTRIIIDLLKVRHLIRSGETRFEEDGTRIAVLDRDVPPFSWAGWIVMSREDFESGNRHIIEHEKAHIRLGHSWYVLLVDVLASMQWFNPAMWLLRSDLRAIFEYEADDVVLSQGADIREYQYSLIGKAISASGYSITNSFNHSILKNRITMMSKSRSSMSGAFKALYVLPLVAAALTANAKTVTSYKYSDMLPGTENTTAQDITVPEDIEETSVQTVAVPQIIEEPEVQDVNVPETVEEPVSQSGIAPEDMEELVDQTAAVTEDVKEPDFQTTALLDTVIIVPPTSVEDAQTPNVVVKRKDDGPEPLIIIDGKESSRAEMEKISPDDIESIEVLKDQAAVEKYGEKTGNGVVIINMRNGQAKGRETDDAVKVDGGGTADNAQEAGDGEAEVISTLRVVGGGKISDEGTDLKVVTLPGNPADQPLYILDGKEITPEKFARIDPSGIESIEVLKDQTAVEGYGDKGRNGVLIITLKAHQAEDEVTLYDSKNPSTWRRFLRFFNSERRRSAEWGDFQEHWLYDTFWETHDRTTHSTNHGPNYNYKLMNAKPSGK